MTKVIRDRRLGLKFLGALCGIGFALSACGSSSASSATVTSSKPTTTTSPYMTVSQERAYYLSILKPYNATGATFSADAKQWNNQTPMSQIVAQTNPLVQAISGVMTKLTDGRWQPSTAIDVHSLVSAFAAIQSDLQQISKLTIFDLNTWEAGVAKDLNVGQTDANLVRHDIGLPPVTN